MNPCSVVQYVVFSLKFCNYGTCCKFGNVYTYPYVCSLTIPVKGKKKTNKRQKKCSITQLIMFIR